MRRYPIWLLLTALSSVSLYAQTNVFPSSGNVGIGTINPGDKLVVVGKFTGLSGPAGVQGTHFVSLAPGVAPSLGFVRSVNTWSDNWWDLTMGTDNKLRLGFCSVPQAEFTNGSALFFGSMGIGTAVPASKLHISSSASGLTPMVYAGGALPQWPAILQTISGSTASNSTGAIVGLNLENASPSAGTYSPFITFSRKSDSGSYNPTIAGIAGLYTGPGPDSNWGAGALTLWTAGASVYGPLERMRIDSTGKVGIGTTTPGSLLDVAGNPTFGNASTGTCVTIRSYSDGRPWAIRDDAGVNRLRFSRGGSDQAFWDILKTPGSDAIAGQIWHANGAERIRLDANGNVGIGTSGPTHKLSVNGTIRAKEVIVETNWSDYVFAPDYRLAPLSEVEQHIKEKQHLPGVPSAAEVAAQGLSIGEMQSKLLAKVEELTLHLIRIEKENAELRRQVMEIRARN